MGYKRQETHYQLRFADADMAGLEITSRAPSIGELLAVGPIAEVIDQNQPDLGQLRAVLEAFCRVLVSWNLEEDDGAPVPMTPEALLTFEVPFLMKVLNAWAEVVTSVDPTRPGASGSGPASQETRLQIPMEPMTESPGS